METTVKSFKIFLGIDGVLGNGGEVTKNVLGQSTNEEVNKHGLSISFRNCFTPHPFVSVPDSTSRSFHNPPMF